MDLNASRGEQEARLHNDLARESLENDPEEIFLAENNHSQQENEVFVENEEQKETITAPISRWTHLLQSNASKVHEEEPDNQDDGLYVTSLPSKKRGRKQLADETLQHDMRESKVQKKLS